MQRGMRAEISLEEPVVDVRRVACRRERVVVDGVGDRGVVPGRRPRLWHRLRGLLPLCIRRRSQARIGGVGTQRGAAGALLETGPTTATRLCARLARRGQRRHALALALRAKVLAQKLRAVAARPIRHGGPGPRTQVPDVTHRLHGDIVPLRQHRG